MKTYEFKYTVTPKAGDNSWWCDIRGKSFETEAESLNDAKQDFVSHLDNTWSVEVSKTALAKPDKMYRDRKDLPPEVIGYVFTGSHEVLFENGWKKRICWIWTEIREINIPDEIH